MCGTMTLVPPYMAHWLSSMAQCRNGFTCNTDWVKTNLLEKLVKSTFMLGK